MKKPKVSLNGAAIKNFFINNGEKIILAAVVLLLFNFAYGAITAQPIDPTMPDQIKRASEVAQQRINEVEWPKPMDEHPEWNAKDYKPGVEEAIAVLPSSGKLNHDRELDPAPFKSLVKRTDPKILPPIELFVYGTSALVPYVEQVPADEAKVPAGALPPRRRDAEKDKKGKKTGGKAGAAGPEGENRIPPRGPGGGRGRPRGGDDEFGGGRPTPAAAVADRSVTGAQLPGARAVGAKLVPKYMTVVTALVPFEEQFNEYKKRFEDALGKDMAGASGGSQFMPMYYFFRIQRAEVKDHREQVAEANWKSLDAVAAANDSALWFGAGQQIEPPIDPLYSFRQGQGQSQAGQYVDYLEWPLPPMILKDWGFEVTHPKVPFLKPMQQELAPETGIADPLANDPMGTGMPNAPGGATPRIGGGASRPGFGGGFGNRRGGGMDDEFGGRGGRGPMRGPMGGSQGTAGMSYAPEVPYKLYRYVDMTCEKGKCYRYRVQLVLQNPNYEFPPAYLEKPESAKERFAMSPYSEPSPVAVVPMNAQALAAGSVVKSGEPEANVSLLELVEWKADPRRRPGAGAGAAAGDELGGGLSAVNTEPTSGWVEVLKDFPMMLGAVAYFSPVTAEKVLDMAVEIEKKKIENLTMNAHLAMLIDVRSDDPLAMGKSKGAVTEMLFFDKDGRLFTSSSAEGHLKSEDYKDRTWVSDDISGGGFQGMGDEFGGRPPARPGPGRGKLGE